MKILKSPLIIFSLLFLLQLTSCTHYTLNETTTETPVDSVAFYTQVIKTDTLDDSVCLEYVNKALSFKSKDAPITTLLNYKLNSFYNLRMQDSVLSTSKKIITHALKEKDSAAIGNSYFTLAYYYTVFKMKDSAFINFKTSKEIYEHIKDSVGMGQSLAQMAIIQSDYGDYEGSDENAVFALKYLDKTNIPYLTSVYNCIAINARKQYDYKEAIYWYNKAIENTTSKTFKATYLNNVANAYRDQKQYDIAIGILKELKKDTLLNTNAVLKARVLDNLAYTQWVAYGQTAVEADLQLALQLRTEQADIFGQIASYSHLAAFYTQSNKTKALAYAKKMYDTATLIKSPQDQLEALQKLIEFTPNSISKKYYIDYVTISHNIAYAEKQKLNKFVKLKFDSEKNREENLQLKISTAQKELEIANEKTKNTILFSSGSLIFIGFIAFIYFKKQKYILEKRAEVYKTEKRIAKKIHDEVANNVVHIMNKIQYTTTNKETLLDDLDKVYLLTRNISHENNAIATGPHFTAFLKNMLVSFNSPTTNIILKDIAQAELSTIDSEKQIEIYRVLQECMVNMRKHSKASLVAITFKKRGNSYEINYSDNGVGLDTDTLEQKNGLQNVETRIKFIQGTITFETSLNHGFKIFIRFKN